MKIAIYIFSILLLTSCNVEPKKVNYGKDHCHFCNMTVVDQTHASEYVTKKGKAYVFDAIECMVNELIDLKNEENTAFVLVTNYEIPGKMIDANTASFLISKEIKSPMGANLSAFATTEKATAMLNKYGGKIYTWKQLKTKFSK
jgi:copper chaperone NosL